MADVRPATRADIGPLSVVLARAFYDDPPMVWMLPDGRTRLKRSRRLFATVLGQEGLARGAVDVLADADTILAGAVWFPPGSWPAPVSRQLLALPAYLWALGRRFGPSSELMAGVARVHPSTRHWYLFGVGVEPARQGAGLGSELLRSRLARIDTLGEAAYLESSKPGNVPLYAHLGFVAQAPPVLAASAPPIIPMHRPGAREVPR